jgi:hypothetical protein
MTFDFAPLTWVYLVVALTTLAVTVIGRRRDLIFGAVIVLASWFASNEILRLDGYATLVGHDAVVCGGLAVCVAGVGIPGRSAPLAILFGLFFLNVLVDVATLAAIRLLDLNVTHGLTLWYAVTVNAIFLASCLVLGAAGVGTRLADSSAHGDLGAGRGRKRRHVVVSGMARKARAPR